jgi:hypothetical protein
MFFGDKFFGDPPALRQMALYFVDSSSGNVIIRKAQRAIQGDDCRPRRRSWPRFPLLAPIRDSFGSGFSAVARVSDRGRLAKV